MKHKDYLLDTNILGPLAELKAGLKSPECTILEKHFSALSENSRLLLCPISIGEVESGVRVDTKNCSKKGKLTQEILVLYECLNIDKNTARDCYAELRARLFNKRAPKDKDNRKQRRMKEWNAPTFSKELQIDENDLWIAAVAMAHNLILVTRDGMTAIKEVAGNDVTFENWLEDDPEDDVS